MNSKNKKSKIMKFIMGSNIGIVTIGLVIIIPCLMLMDFFGANITDGYVENNMDYADSYKATLNKNIKTGNGYVSLSRILYFYLEDDKLSFDEIYKDNLNSELKKQKAISEVCTLDKYKKYSVCSANEISESSQIDEEQNKPFSSPLDIKNMNVTSYFMENRVVYGEEDTHSAWDLSSSAQTPVYSVCDGVVEKVSFPFTENKINTSAGGGNQIRIKCEIDEDTNYSVLYAHLFPNSSKVKEGDKVSKWQQIAQVGTTGYSTGNHLHFQVMKDGTAVDGMSLIDFTDTEKTQVSGGYDINFDNKYLENDFTLQH